MSFKNPLRTRSRLSLYSILALIGLFAFAAVVLAANPFSVSASSGATGASASSSPSPQAGIGAGQGSLLTGTPSSQSSHFGNGGHHHHYLDGNSTTGA